MALYKISEFDSDYRDSFPDGDIKGLSVYTEGNNEKIGSVSDILVDEGGKFRYLVVDLGFWIFGKKVLLPVGRSRIDRTQDRVFAIGMTRQQAEELPQFEESLAMDYDYEERVRGVYRAPSYSGTAATSTLDASAPLDSPIPLESSAPLDAAVVSATTPNVQPISTPASAPTYDRDTYNYERDASLYDMNENDHQTLRLYEERLLANKQRRKAGEVAIGKHVETETARVSMPLEKERVVVERVTPSDRDRVVDAGSNAFREGEVAHMDIYEETPDIRKETVVREEVRVRKVVDTETVEAQENIRREELDVNSSGLPVDDR